MNRSSARQVGKPQRAQRRIERHLLTEKVIGCAKLAGIGRGLLLNFNVELSQGRNHPVQTVTRNSVYSVPSVVSHLAEHMPMNRSRFALASSLSGYFIRSRWLSKYFSPVTSPCWAASGAATDNAPVSAILATCLDHKSTLAIRPGGLLRTASRRH